MTSIATTASALLARSLRTLVVRVRQQNASAQSIAETLRSGHGVASRTVSCVLPASRAPRQGR
ncbi:PLP-dependent transferase [Halomonas sediminis]